MNKSTIPKLKKHWAKRGKQRGGLFEFGLGKIGFEKIRGLPKFLKNDSIGVHGLQVAKFRQWGLGVASELLERLEITAGKTGLSRL
jgi:hypothetical protein